MSRALKRDLSIVTWNANGIGCRHSDLLEFVARLKLDVLLTSETHLTPASRFRLPNYVCYRDDRVGGRGGGTAVAVKASIGHHRVVLPRRTHLEATAIEVHGALGGVLVVSAYKRPQKELLVPDLEAVFNTHRRVIMADDLNSNHRDWNSHVTATNGKRLRRFADSRRCTVIGPVQPTIYLATSNANPDVLDIVVTQGIDCPVEVTSLTELSSDHNPISVHVATQHGIARDERKVVDWLRYGPALSRRLPEAGPLDTIRQIDEATAAIDEATAAFDEAIIYAVDVSSRMKPGLTPDYHRIPEEVTLLTREKNYYRRRWQTGRDPADKAAYNRATGKLRRSMQAFRRSCWEYAVA